VICADKLSIQEVCEKISLALSYELALHHSVYKQPSTGTYLEELVSKATKHTELNNEYIHGSHKVGEDQKIDGYRISNKSGVLQPDGKGKWANSLKINGSRTSKYKSLESKLNFLSDDHYDFTLCCARIESEWDNGERIYHLIALPHMDYSSMNWSLRGDEVSDFAHTCVESHPDMYAKINNYGLFLNLQCFCIIKRWTLMNGVNVSPCPVTT
jgi:hypothetical protein